MFFILIHVSVQQVYSLIILILHALKNLSYLTASDIPNTRDFHSSLIKMLQISYSYINYLTLILIVFIVVLIKYN